MNSSARDRVRAQTIPTLNWHYPMQSMGREEVVKQDPCTNAGGVVERRCRQRRGGEL
jgi:hypothetical protein